LAKQSKAKPSKAGEAKPADDDRPAFNRSAAPVDRRDEDITIGLR
jgi:hypothetical protein